MLLDEIAAFAHVVRAGSFTAAARNLGVPKSTLSRAVTRLEDSTGVRLLRRTTRTLVVTEAGQTFYQQATPHLAGLSDAAEALRDADQQPKGTLRLTAPVEVAESFLGDLLVRFTARYPQVRTEVDLSGRLVNLVDEGFDVALRASMRLQDSSLVARKIAGTEFHLYASPTYLARRGMPQTPDDLAAHDCILFRPRAKGGEWPIRGPGGLLRTVAVSGRIGSNNFTLLRSVARAGGGIAPLPSFTVQDELQAGTLVRVLPDWVRPAGTMYVVYPSARHVPKKVSAFRDFVLEYLG